MHNSDLTTALTLVSISCCCCPVTSCAVGLQVQTDPSSSHCIARPAIYSSPASTLRLTSKIQYQDFHDDTNRALVRYNYLDGLLKRIKRSFARCWSRVDPGLTGLTPLLPGPPFCRHYFEYPAHDCSIMGFHASPAGRTAALHINLQPCQTLASFISSSEK